MEIFHKFRVISTSKIYLKFVMSFEEKYWSTFTYGQRTIHGILKDGWNALMRYYLNNFCDGTKQDAIDLLQGHFIVSISRDMTPTSQNGGIEAIASFPLALSLIVTGFFFAMMSLRRVRNDFWQLLFSIFWASISLAIAAFVKANGRIFCNRPRLHQPRR